MSGRVDRRYVADCVQRIGQIVDEVKADDLPAERAGIFDGDHVSETAITEAVFMDRLEAEVQAVRLEIFGKIEAPFSDYAQAVEWIEGEERADRERMSSDSAKLKKSIDQLRKLLDKMSDAMGRPVSARLETPGLRYLKPGLGIRGIKVKLGSKLLPLQAFAQSGESCYGFSKWRLIGYVLANIRPQLVRITVGTVMSFGQKPPTTTITILGQLPCWDDLRSAYQLIQEETNRKRARRLDGEDEAVVSAIRRQGGVPERKGAQEFWERVGKEVGKSRGAARMRFRRLPEEIRVALQLGHESAEPADLARSGEILQTAGPSLDHGLAT